MPIEFRLWLCSDGRDCNFKNILVTKYENFWHQLSYFENFYYGKFEFSRFTAIEVIHSPTHWNIVAQQVDTSCWEEKIYHRYDDNFTFSSQVEKF